MNEVKIRPYEAKDKKYVIECIVGLQEHERAIDPTKLVGKEMAPGYLDYIISECKKNNGKIFVAEVKDKIVGFSCVWIEEDGGITVVKEKIAYFSDLYVKPEFRRKGIATLLIQARKQHALIKVSKRQKFTL